jgi:plastocyanin
MMTGRLCGKLVTATAPIAAAFVLFAASDPMVVRIQDQCDPTTFNAAVGPGTCTGNGQITFNHFIAEVTNAHKAGAWHYDPAAGTLAPGTVVSLENRGGETHTFTKVKNFGGGFVAPLNALSGNPVPAPECAIVTLGGLVPKPPSAGNIFVEAGETEDGPTAGNSILPSGTTTKFQCCIHPWMRTELTAK